MSLLVAGRFGGILRVVFLLLCSISALAAAPALARDGASDAQFSSLFSAWVKMDGADAGASTQDNDPAHSSIPSRQPVDRIALSSSFGTRADPFNGHRRMHQGIDIPGPLGTPVYATADGVVQRAEWASGYGNLIEVSHGNGLETRYGHLSKVIAQPNERVRRGQLIGLMGSTGRSTGSHLHYEVRIAGAAVNPMPYLEGTNYEIALADAKAHADADVEEIAVGGPEARKSNDNKAQ
jgi:murein DD-endopeptidase MepM/ murein hydrolase activator NlpD